MRQPYLEVGKIVSTHGVRGEVRVDPWCDSPDFLRPYLHLVCVACPSACQQGSAVVS